MENCSKLKSAIHPPGRKVSKNRGAKSPSVTRSVNHERLRELLGFGSYDEVRIYHKRWVEDFLGNGNNIQDDKWTKSIAVGNRSFVDRVKSLMGIFAVGRKSIGTGDSYQLREPSIPYGAHLGAKKCDIGPENTYFWDVIPL